MHEIENEIARLQLRSEQILFHLQQVPFGSRDAVAARRNLDRMARKLVALKGERDLRRRELERAARQISVAQRPGITGSCATVGTWRPPLPMTTYSHPHGKRSVSRQTSASR